MVQPALLQTTAFFVADFDIFRGQEVHAVGDAIHSATEPVRQPTRKVDQATTKVAVDLLEVQDDRLVGLEMVGDGLGLVELPRSNNVWFH